MFNNVEQIILNIGQTYIYRKMYCETYNLLTIVKITKHTFSFINNEKALITIYKKSMNSHFALLQLLLINEKCCHSVESF